MSLPVFVAFLLAIAALRYAARVADSTQPPRGVTNTPRQNLDGCTVNIGLALCGLGLLVALCIVVVS